MDPLVIRCIALAPPLPLIAWHSLSSFLLVLLLLLACSATYFPLRRPPNRIIPPLSPTVEAGCLEAGECPSLHALPPEMSTLCPPTHSKVFILSLSTAPHPSLSPSLSPLSSSGMQQLLCELVPEGSFPLLPFLPSLLLFFFFPL